MVEVAAAMAVVDGTGFPFGYRLGRYRLWSRQLRRRGGRGRGFSGHLVVVYGLEILRVPFDVDSCRRDSGRLNPQQNGRADSSGAISNSRLPAGRWDRAGYAPGDAEPAP